MPDPVDPILAALQAKMDDAAPSELPLYLGRTNSVVVVDGPKLRFVLTANVAHHELDLEWGAVIGLYASIRDVLGDAVTTAEDQTRAQIADLENQLATVVSHRDALSAELATVRDAAAPTRKSRKN